MLFTFLYTDENHKFCCFNISPKGSKTQNYIFYQILEFSGFQVYALQIIPKLTKFILQVSHAYEMFWVLSAD